MSATAPDRARTAAARPGSSEAGEAAVEFIALVVLVVIPLVYLLILTLSLTGATFAVNAAARSATRVAITHPESLDLAEAAARLPFTDHGLAPTQQVQISCDPRCQAGAVVEVVVSYRHPLPGIPAWLAANLHTEIPMQASNRGVIFGGGNDP